jgi:hypothetical protein
MMRLELVAFTCLVLFAGTAVGKDKGEHLEFKMGQEWKAVNSGEVPGHYFMMEFVREGDDIKSWKELVTVQNFDKSRSMRSPEQTLNDLKAAREKNCPGATEWNVIDKKEDSILYEWHAKTCLDQPEQSEIAKIIYGKRNVFLLHYAVKVHEFSPDTRAEWIKKFTSAGIEGAH